MYESKMEPLLARALFRRRLMVHASLAVGLIAVSLGIGIVGYCQFEHLAVLDGFLNTAMLLGGMGPVNAPVTPAGKLFAGLFALYAGLVFIVTAGLVFAPLVHRLMHRLHWDQK
jgi:hypothetical protein